MLGSAGSCVEIVIHAKPEKAALHALLAVYWYASFGKDPADTILESDHLVFISSYGEH